MNSKARGAIVATCTAMAVMLGAATAAQAAVNSWDGGCSDIRGIATVDKPLTRSGADNVYHFQSTAHCYGKLNGRSISNAPIESRSDGPFYGSCIRGGHSTAAGPGFIRFTNGTPDHADDIVIRTWLTWISDNVDGTLNGTYFELRGEESGHGSGRSDPPVDAWPGFYKDCAGDGVSSVRFEAYFYTDTPLVSEAPRPPAGRAPTLLLGAPHGMRAARSGQPFEIGVRTSGAKVLATQVLVRAAGTGAVVGRSERFSVGARRKVVQVAVDHRLADGRYKIVAAGHDANGREVRATRDVQLHTSNEQGQGG